MIRNLTGDFYLIVRKKGYYLGARLTNQSPALKAGEVAVKLSLQMPETLFQCPQLQAKVVIPADAVTPPVLNATVLDNVREILSQQTGMDIQVSLVEQEA